MRKIYLVLIFCLVTLICCKDKQGNEVKDKKSIVTKECVSKISYEEALSYYGEPLETTFFENAKQNEISPGIRAGIGKHYKGESN
jgi:hypothetical protein